MVYFRIQVALVRFFGANLHAHPSSQSRAACSKKMGNLGKKIRAVRKKSGMSQSELSRRVKTPRTHIVAIEKGRRGIGLALLSRISLVLGVQINFFLDRAQVEGAKIAPGTKPRIRSL